tara:strand:- start:159 stop:395 length:237 start_codon:yes stop_codon:yes gene_type:complete
MSKIENLIEKDNLYYRELLLNAEDEIRNLNKTVQDKELTISELRLALLKVQSLTQTNPIQMDSINAVVKNQIKQILHK